MPCGAGRSLLRSWAFSPVCGFGFPCTGKHAALHGIMHSPYTGVPFSLHGGFNFPTRRFGVPYTEQEGIWRIDGIIDVRGRL